MGDFANWLNAAGSIFGAATSAIGAGQRIEKQKKAQMELNRQAAELNYGYGEKAAQNAFERQLQMYERSYQDQSFSAMRKQAEDAGLSVGMLYGNGGPGGQGGATSGAPQGETGGAQAGDAASMYANEMQRQLGLKQLALQNAGLIKDLKIKDKQADDLEASAKQKNAETKTEDALREERYYSLQHENEFKWIKNFQERAKMSLGKDGTVQDQGDDKNVIASSESARYGAITILEDSIWAGLQKGELDNLIKRGAEIDANTGLAEAMGSLKSEEAKYYYTKVMSEILKNNNEAALSYAKKLATLYDIGEFVNWQKVLDYGLQGIQTIGNIVMGVGAGKKILKKLEQPIQEIMNEEKTVTTAKGSYTSSTHRHTTKGR